MPDISVIICTRNRADSLRRTLEAFGRIRIPGEREVELVVVDNGSTDSTPAVVKSTHFNKLKLRYFFEPKSGLSNARNTGLSVGQGEIIIFTDDDVVPAADWLERLATPLLEKRYDAVVGRIEMAEHLRRPWMTPIHKIWLAAPEMTCGWELELIGANMGFHRSVLNRVPAFDPELGAGALGFGEESLFSWQLVEAGYRLHEVPEALIVHYFEPSRLLRSQWLDACRRRGHIKAYLLHHWGHGNLKYPKARICYLAAKLFLRRILQPPPPLDAEGCAPWEISYVGNIETCRQFLKERIRPRHYAKHGLVRLDMAGK
jgi:glycosyltransferase involved in cell wall biosynthesis